MMSRDVSQVLNLFAKTLLASTSLAPVLGAVAVTSIEQSEPWTLWIWFILIAILLIVVCWLLLEYQVRNGQKELITIKEFERKDQEMLVFLFIYLLPFLRSVDPVFSPQWLTGGYILVIIILAIADTEAFHFNPVMRLLRYRFYSIRTQDGLSNLLISKRELRRTREINTVSLGRNIYIYTGGEDA